MKKFIAGILIGAMLFVPTGVLADRIIETPVSNPIYDVNKENDISVFDDQDNKCYVYHDTSDVERSGISCIKETR